MKKIKLISRKATDLKFGPCLKSGWQWMKMWQKKEKNEKDGERWRKRKRQKQRNKLNYRSARDLKFGP